MKISFVLTEQEGTLELMYFKSLCPIRVKSEAQSNDLDLPNTKDSYYRGSEQKGTTTNENN